jgi:hypothetical protein
MTVNEKQSDQKKQDLLKRNAEMAENTQSPEVAAKIFKKGDKYYCAECNAELPIHTDCPGCHAHIDWERVKSEMG